MPPNDPIEQFNISRHVTDISRDMKQRTLAKFCSVANVVFQRKKIYSRRICYFFFCTSAQGQGCKTLPSILGPGRNAQLMSTSIRGKITVVRTEDGMLC